MARQSDNLSHAIMALARLRAGWQAVQALMDKEQVMHGATQSAYHATAIPACVSALQ